MSRTQSVLRDALALVSLRLILRQIGLALLVLLLAALWLHVPDASALDVSGSVVLGLIVVAVAGMGESWILLWLCGLAPTRARLARGCLWLLVGGALWLGWSAVIDHLRIADELRAGYLNSRFPHSMRHFFSYEHILQGLGWMWSVLTWVGAGVVAAFVFAAIASSRPLRTLGRTLRSATYWFALVAGTMGATTLTVVLLRWRPGRGLAVETLSLLLRLSLATVVDGVVVSLLLTILAVWVKRSDADVIA